MNCGRLTERTVRSVNSVSADPDELGSYPMPDWNQDALGTIDFGLDW